MNKLKKNGKILIANDSVGYTGVQVTVGNLTSVLEEKGYEVVVMQTTDREFLKIKVPIEEQFTWALFATPIVTERILIEKPDAILITTVEASIGKATKDVCEFLETSKICTQCPYTLMYTTNHGIGAYKNLHNVVLGKGSDKNRKINDIEKKIIYSVEERFIQNKFSGAKRVLVNAQSSKEKLEDIGIDNISVIPRGIDLGKFHLPNKNDTNPYLNYDWYINDPKPILLYLGRVAFEKDIHIFLEGQYPNYHRVVAGPGVALNSLKRKYGKDKNIHFTGPISRDDVPNFFMFSRLSFFPSSFDTFGITIIESAACGTPVVGFDVPGPKDVIKQDVMGIVVPKEKNIFDGLDKALKIDRKKCSEYTRENYSWEKSTEGLLNNLYQINWTRI